MQHFKVLLEKVSIPSLDVVKIIIDSRLQTMIFKSISTKEISIPFEF